VVWSRSAGLALMAIARRIPAAAPIRLVFGGLVLRVVPGVPPGRLELCWALPPSFAAHLHRPEWAGRCR